MIKRSTYLEAIRLHIDIIEKWLPRDRSPERVIDWVLETLPQELRTDRLAWRTFRMQAERYLLPPFWRLRQQRESVNRLIIRIPFASDRAVARLLATRKGCFRR